MIDLELDIYLKFFLIYKFIEKKAISIKGIYIKKSTIKINQTIAIISKIFNTIYTKEKQQA